MEKCNEFIRTSKVKGMDKEIIVVGVVVNNKTLVPGSLRNTHNWKYKIFRKYMEKY